MTHIDDLRHYCNDQLGALNSASPPYASTDPIRLDELLRGGPAKDYFTIAAQVHQAMSLISNDVEVVGPFEMGIMSKLMDFREARPNGVKRGDDFINTVAQVELGLQNGLIVAHKCLVPRTWGDFTINFPDYVFEFVFDKDEISMKLFRVMPVNDEARLRRIEFFKTRLTELDVIELMIKDASYSLDMPRVAAIGGIATYATKLNNHTPAFYQWFSAILQHYDVRESTGFIDAYLEAVKTGECQISSLILQYGDNSDSLDVCIDSTKGINEVNEKEYHILVRCCAYNGEFFACVQQFHPNKKRKRDAEHTAT